MLSVPHLTASSTGLVSEEQSDDVQPGIRVRSVPRPAGRRVRPERRPTPTTSASWPLDRVISAEPVLTPRGARRLVDAVAARYAGTRPDVLRWQSHPGTPARRKRGAVPLLLPVIEPVDPTAYATSAVHILEALRDGRAARAVWQALPGERW